MFDFQVQVLLVYIPNIVEAWKTSGWHGENITRLFELYLLLWIRKQSCSCFMLQKQHEVLFRMNAPAPEGRFASMSQKITRLWKSHDSLYAKKKKNYKDVAGCSSGTFLKKVSERSSRVLMNCWKHLNIYCYNGDNLLFWHNNCQSSNLEIRAENLIF